MARTLGPLAPAVYTVTPTMLERMRLGSHHHAVCKDDGPNTGQGLLVALCGDEPGLDSESAAYAHLFAAAPLMLDALKLLNEVRGAVTFHDGWATLEDGTEIYLGDLIAQAEGRR